MEALNIQCKFTRAVTRTESGWGIAMYTARQFGDFPPDVKKNAKPGICYFTASGTNLPEERYVDITLNGSWKRSKYGTQFQVNFYDVKTPTTEDDIEKYLASGAVKGIGKATARSIVLMFGTEALDVIRRTPEKLLAIRGISEKSLETIRSTFTLKTGFQELSVLLNRFGITGEQINSTYNTFGDESAALVKRNPYLLMNAGFSFPAVDKVARGLNVALDSVTRLTTGVTYECGRLMRETGNMFCMRDELFDASLDLLNVGSSPYAQQVTMAQVQSAFYEAVSRGDLVHRFPETMDIVYTAEADEAELETARSVSALINAAEEDGKLKAAIDKWQAGHPELRLTNGQKKAVESVVENRISVITGGAGVGKTTVAKAIVEAYTDAHPDKAVTLLAPTGKAAKRMTEAIGFPASTIHSALHIGLDETFAFGGLDEGLVIVDEVSMLDQFVAKTLFTAVQDGSTVVLLGDVNQLPSVGAGTVLSELIRSQKVHVTYLTEVMRQEEGSSIIGNSYLINEGVSELDWDSNFSLINAGLDEAEAIVLKTYMEEVRKYGMDEVAVLCPRRKSGVCANALNTAIQAALDKGEPSVTLHGQKFRVGDRIIQTRNTEKASNGEVGYLTSISDEVFGIKFDGMDAEIEYSKKEMDDIDLSYALTIHKSQGSEYKSVIIPLLSSMTCQLYKRNLLYTAVTRGKEKVTIIGDKKAIKTCCDNSESGTRRSLLANRIYLSSK